MPPKKDAAQMRQPRISFAARKRTQLGFTVSTADKAAQKPTLTRAKRTSEDGERSTQTAEAKKPRRYAAETETEVEEVEDDGEEVDDEPPARAVVLEDEGEEEEQGETKTVRDEREVSDLQVRKTAYTPISSEQNIEIHWGELTLSEKLLRKFDLNMRYGPAVGITRLERWMRAKKGGLDPPADVYALLTGPDGETERYKESLFAFQGL